MNHALLQSAQLFQEYSVKSSNKFSQISVNFEFSDPEVNLVKYLSGIDY